MIFLAHTTKLAHSDEDTSVAIKERVLAKKPPLYAVLLINDDYTPMEFVIAVLEKHFDKDHAAATDVMLKVHKEGQAVCGVYPYEIARNQGLSGDRRVEKTGISFTVHYGKRIRGARC